MRNPEIPKTQEPPDSNPPGSKDPREMGNNGNPAQSAGRVTMQEQDAHPASLENPMEADAEQMPDSLPHSRNKEASIPWG